MTVFSCLPLHSQILQQPIRGMKGLHARPTRSLIATTSHIEGLSPSLLSTGSQHGSIWWILFAATRLCLIFRRRERLIFERFSGVPRTRAALNTPELLRRSTGDDSSLLKLDVSNRKQHTGTVYPEDDIFGFRLVPEWSHRFCFS